MIEPEFLDTPAALANFLSNLGGCDGQPPRFYVDLEGNNLSRMGTLSLVTIMLEPEKTVHLVDVTTLGQQAFMTAGRDGRTLKGILESSSMIKVFFDIRNDSDALFNLHGVHVAGIEDLQLMELASRNFSKRHINGLAKCIERDSAVSFEEKGRWRAVKERGKRLFDPQQGGTYAVFDHRPLSDEIKEYCTQDVILMPHLRDIYRENLCDAWWKRIEAETNARIQLSQSSTFVGKGQHMAQAPSEWISWWPTPAEILARTMVQVVAPRTPAFLTVAGPSTIDVDSARPEESDDLADMMRRVALTAADRDFGTGGNEDDAAGATDRDGGFEDSDSDGDRDMSACDRECGYCGRCDY